MIRTLVADDHHLMRRGIRELLDNDPEIEVCGEASNGRQALELARQLQPDVAVLDLAMPELNGIDVIRNLRKESSKVEMLVYSMHDSEELVREVFAAGARGYVLKSDDPLHLTAAIKSLSGHEPFFSPRVSEAILNSLISLGTGEKEPSINDPLTLRQREILQLLAENKTNKEIAYRLCISVRTVETHRRSIMQKVNATSIVELVHYAIRNGMVRTHDCTALNPLDTAAVH